MEIVNDRAKIASFVVKISIKDTILVKAFSHWLSHACNYANTYHDVVRYSPAKTEHQAFITMWKWICVDAKDLLTVHITLRRAKLAVVSLAKTHDWTCYFTKYAP